MPITFTVEQTLKSYSTLREIARSVLENSELEQECLDIFSDAGDSGLAKAARKQVREAFMQTPNTETTQLLRYFRIVDECVLYQYLKDKGNTPPDKYEEKVEIYGSATQSPSQWPIFHAIRREVVDLIGKIKECEMRTKSERAQAYETH
ncbi:hypothetical protein JW826_02100 [Candidatus Woesearchaeota archaeon]|nr:hypothetical protein [Candidatus Woesearchaeota archaeon]